MGFQLPTSTGLQDFIHQQYGNSYGFHQVANPTRYPTHQSLRGAFDEGPPIPSEVATRVVQVARDLGNPEKDLKKNGKNTYILTPIPQLTRSSGAMKKKPLAFHTGFLRMIL